MLYRGMKVILDDTNYQEGYVLTTEGQDCYGNIILTFVPNEETVNYNDVNITNSTITDSSITGGNVNNASWTGNTFTNTILDGTTDFNGVVDLTGTNLLGLTIIPGNNIVGGTVSGNTGSGNTFTDTDFLGATVFNGTVDLRGVIVSGLSQNVGNEIIGGIVSTNTGSLNNFTDTTLLGTTDLNGTADFTNAIVTGTITQPISEVIGGTIEMCFGTGNEFTDTTFTQFTMFQGIVDFTGVTTVGLPAITTITDAGVIMHDTTINNVSVDMHGFVPKGTGLQSTYLKGDGTWQTYNGPTNVYMTGPRYTIGESVRYTLENINPGHSASNIFSANDVFFVGGEGTSTGLGRSLFYKSEKSEGNGYSFGDCNYPYDHGDLIGMTYGNGRYVGILRKPDKSISYVISSADGLNWDSRILCTTPDYVQHIIFANGIFSFLTYMTNYISRDGLTIGNSGGADHRVWGGVAYKDGAYFFASNSTYYYPQYPLARSYSNGGISSIETQRYAALWYGSGFGSYPDGWHGKSIIVGDYGFLMKVPESSTQFWRFDQWQYIPNYYDTVPLVYPVTLPGYAQGDMMFYHKGMYFVQLSGATFFASRDLLTWDNVSLSSYYIPWGNTKYVATTKNAIGFADGYNHVIITDTTGFTAFNPY